MLNNGDRNHQRCHSREAVVATLAHSDPLPPSISYRTHQALVHHDVKFLRKPDVLVFESSFLSCSGHGQQTFQSESKRRGIQILWLHSALRLDGIHSRHSQLTPPSLIHGQTARQLRTSFQPARIGASMQEPTISRRIYLLQDAMRSPDSIKSSGFHTTARHTFGPYHKLPKSHITAELCWGQGTGLSDQLVLDRSWCSSDSSPTPFARIAHRCLPAQRPLRPAQQSLDLLLLQPRVSAVCCGETSGCIIS